ncbi:MAG: metallophosphoesterase family protein, partial [Acidimicrobiales bacterium]
YIYPETEVAALGPDEARFVFTGQTHRPFVRRSDPTTYVNVGSCGLPRDCGHLGAACVFDAVSGEVEILRFDIRAATRAALERCGPVAPEVLAVFDRRGPDCHES